METLKDLKEILLDPVKEFFTEDLAGVMHTLNMAVLLLASVLVPVIALVGFVWIIHMLWRVT